jgi:putative DNA primase/helicase
MVARAIWPGCKVDTMPVFEGAQGQGKSLVIEKLVGADYYAVMNESPDSKDFYVFMAGKWLIEIAELDAFSRADVKSVKRTLSTAIDRYRTPYGRHAADFKRQCVFAGSTNRDDWNHDATGARRFWPVACRAAHPEIAEANRDQYFAEAMHALMHDGDRPSWWSFSKETAKRVEAEQSARFAEDDWTNTVLHVCTGREFVYPSEIYRELGFEADKDVTRAAQMRVAEIMKRIGWVSRDVWDKAAARPRRRWVKL